MEDQEIVHIALENLQKTTGIVGEWRPQQGTDGNLNLLINGEQLHYVVEVKKEVRPHQVEQLLRYRNQYPNVILIAQHIYPTTKKDLHELNFPYLEANGNIFIKEDDFWLWIDTNRAIAMHKKMGNRAFTKTGLKVLFFLLLDRDHVNLPQRIIAEETGVALGNIPQVIDGLKATGHLLQLGKNTMVWESKLGLVDRWITEYETTLKPQLLIGRFKLPGDWKNLHLNSGEEVWGGEPAGDILTNHLRPEELTIFTKKKRIDFIKTYGLKPDEKGELMVYQWFWNAKGVEAQDTVPPLLAYTDLRLKNNKRCNETAGMIWNEYIQPNI